MSKLDALILDTNRIPAGRLAYTVIGLLVAFTIWAMLATLDEVASAPGEVIPQGRIKTIQHLEGGIIDALMVREGDVVKEGAALLQLDLGASSSNADELRLRLDGYKLTKLRLEAEATGVAPVFPPELAKKYPAMITAEMATYTARSNELVSSLNVLKRQVTQRERDVSEVKVKFASAEGNLALARERLRMSNDLMRDKLQAPMEHLEIEREVLTIKGEMDSLREILPRAEASLGETRERLAEMQLKYSREARERLYETELAIARTDELLTSASDQETRTGIRSPIAGVVKNLRYTTIGGVVRPGEPIMDIVPSEEALVVEAKLNPMDRGFVRTGQRAVVKIDTYDFARYGGIDGEVISVAPDSTIAEGGLSYFKVIVKTAKPYLGEESELLLISPGMGATVDIHTGSKSVMRYLLKPVLKLKSEAFHER